MFYIPLVIIYKPPTIAILYRCCTGGTECLSCTPGSHPPCAVRTLLGVDLKISVVECKQVINISAGIAATEKTVLIRDFINSKIVGKKEKILNRWSTISQYP